MSCTTGFREIIKNCVKIHCRLAYGICLLALLTLTGKSVAGGAACVVAKKMGNSEDIEWVYSSESAETALFQAKQKLREKGYKYLFPQATTELAHAYVVIVESSYKSTRGRDRISYGCGFSKESYDEALWDAIRNLQTYAWGWKPDREGYKIREKNKY